MTSRRVMAVSPVWAVVALVTFSLGFAILAFLAWRIYSDSPPIPSRVTAADRGALFTRDDILSGQHLFQQLGLMELGSVFGHGAYLGPDFTAQYLHGAALDMIAFHRNAGMSDDEARAQAERELKANTYDAASGELRFTPAQAHAYDAMLAFYAQWFGPPGEQTGLRRPHLADPSQARQLTSFFAWASWACAAQRPGTTYSYTNDWPPEPLAGNGPTAPALVWSVLSLIALLGGVGIVLFVFGRYDMLGWHGRTEEGPPLVLQFRPPDQVRLTPAQRATPWYFLVVAGLFLAQGLLGGVNAHYHAEPAGFYGVPLADWLPYNLSRTWHLQLAIFFVATAYLAMGIFLAPLIARREPRGQRPLALVLFAALVLVVIGSLAGEAVSLRGVFRGGSAWFWIGAQGWEYLDLGRFWQILLVAGLAIWCVILVRGMRARLPDEHPGNLPWLFLYSAFTIPVFYAAGLMFGRNTPFAVMDYWRFWVVHLWVEDFLELFTTITVAYLFVVLGVVRPRVALTIVYLDVILYSIGGVVGTMHHLYFSGSPAVHMGFGAFFSAMEVVPLVLLTYEAWHFMRLGGAGPHQSVLDVSSGEFPHKWAVMFLVAVGFWNFLGAGVFGFLVNLPIVSYYEIGTQFTANHGHGAMMGVYGMLAIGFFMFVARYFVPHDRASERAMRISFWSLNVGLAWMIFLNLGPIGTLQLDASLSHGYWYARSPAFYDGGLVRVVEWLRLPGDALFIAGGIVPVVYLALRMFVHRERAGALQPDEETEELTLPGAAR